ncbi:DUF3102 domain-containing protein [Desulfosporosinus youngiae]|uniref:Membrane-bound metallopeptidase n=1 Tax=Desulfosporosinus youngiae DSM 17734 TaxID=768710 RepID=H5XY54_9FIRM|nr:DUF3102 domain-containing protein [Desulfosporosinus youngiae]EHQ91264.1 Protein of unknown function (DUF3102) [Desulfosporosinus youngiae DSM 17734]
MNNVISKRTPLVIAAEINTIKHQTSRVLLANAIEIGRRLKEAKDLFPHGEWGDWLKESVSYSQRTAQRLIQLFQEYGKKQLASLDSNDGSNASLVTHLTYTQAIILLRIPEEEREEFIEKHDIESMTKSELQQAVKDRDQAIEDKNALQKDLDAKSSEITQLTDQAKRLKKQVEDCQANYVAEQEKVTSTLKELEAAAKEEVPSAKETAELENKLQAEKSQSPISKADAQFTIHRDVILNAFNELSQILSALNRIDPEIKENYREKLHTLLQNLAKQIEVWPPIVKTNLEINTGSSGS